MASLLVSKHIIKLLNLLRTPSFKCLIMDLHVDRNTDFFEKADNFSIHNNIASTFIYTACNYETAAITFVIPTYKRVDMLKETIDSVLAQINGCDFSIIVLDNNPERYDITENLMKNYTSPIISYVKNSKNLGMAGNWNRGLMLSKSKWVCLLHDDDVIVPSFLHDLMPYAEKFNNAAIIQTRKYRTTSPDIIPTNYFKKDYSRYFGIDFYAWHIIDVPSGILYNKDIVVKEGGFNPNFYPSMDYIFHMKLALKYKVYVINKFLTWYREGEQNASKLSEVQLAWTVVDYYAVKQLLLRYHFPEGIILPFLQRKSELRIEKEMKLWGTNIKVPYDQFDSKVYSILFKKVSFFLVNYLARITSKFLRVTNC